MADRTARDTQWERQCQLRGRPWRACDDPEDMEGIMPALGRLSTLFPGVAIRAGGVEAGLQGLALEPSVGLFYLFMKRIMIQAGSLDT
jgi:hypothetical protein